MGNTIVFLYPGQGSQHVGMGFDLYQEYPEARQIFEQSERFLNFQLSGLCFKGPEKKLNQDLNAQLSVFTVSCILTMILRANNVFPDPAFPTIKLKGCFSI